MEQLQFLTVNDMRILDTLTAPLLRKLDWTAIEDTDMHTLQEFLAYGSPLPQSKPSFPSASSPSLRSCLMT